MENTIIAELSRDLNLTQENLMELLSNRCYLIEFINTPWLIRLVLEQAVVTLTKTRYVIEDIRAELDIYPSDLVIVEVEFASLEEAEAFTPPSWFGEEVTGNKQYSNAQLALAVI